MTTIKDIIAVLEAVAPPHLQEPYDNSGLLIGNSDRICTGVIFCLDSTEAVVVEAIEKKCNLIIAHHPIIFRGLKRINGNNYIERTAIHAIQNDVAIYAIHTNLDNVLVNGVNAKIAERLGLKNTKILLPKVESNDPKIGAGLIGQLPKAMKTSDFLLFLKDKMKTEMVRHTVIVKNEVETIALCGGSGSFLLPTAVRAGADVFVTADFKYHEFFDADGKLVIADIGHFESEQFTIELLYDLVSEKFATFARHFTTVRTNPVFYV